MPGQRRGRAAGLFEKPLDRRPAVMRDDLRQVELRGDARRRADGCTCACASACGLAHPPSASAVLARADHLAQLPRVLDAPRRADVLDRRRGSPATRSRAGARDRRTRGSTRAVCLHVRNGTTCDRGHIGAEVDDEMTQVVFLLEPDRAVGEEDERAFAASVRAPRGRCRSTRPCSPRPPAPPAADAARPRSPADPAPSCSTRSAVMQPLILTFLTLTPSCRPCSARAARTRSASAALRSARRPSTICRDSRAALGSGSCHSSSSGTMRFRSGSAATRSASCSSWRRSALRRRGRHADHVRRRAVESRARDRRGGRASWVCAACSSRTARRRRPATANALLDRLLGAEVRYVADARRAAPAMDDAAAEAAATGAPALRDSARRVHAAGRRGATRWRSASCSTQIDPPDAHRPRRPRLAGRRPGSSPAADCTGSPRASSASAPTIRRRRWRPRSVGSSRTSRGCSR